MHRSRKKREMGDIGRDSEGGGELEGDRQQIDKTNRQESQAGIRHKDGHRNTFDNLVPSG